MLNNYIVMKSGFGFDPHQVAWATVGFAIIHAPLMFGDSRIVLFNPRSRWWLVPKRRLLDIPVNIKTVQGLRFSARSFDISDSGLFLKIDPEIYRYGQNSFVKTLFSGGRMTLKIVVGRFREIQCDAQVVRCQEHNKGQYPAGLGIRFLDLDLRTKTEINRLLKSPFTQESYMRA